MLEKILKNRTNDLSSDLKTVIQSIINSRTSALMALIPREKKIKLSAVSESAGEMLQENHRVMFLKLLQQPPPLLHG